MTDIVDDRSNRLPELAARIRAEHDATAIAMQRGVDHAMAAGDLLIEAKAQLKHGQWLPWLRDHCAMSERTAQLYMRLAKNRAEIEANPQRAADLSLRGAVAQLAPESEGEPILQRLAMADGELRDAIVDKVERQRSFAIWLYQLPASERAAFLAERSPGERRQIAFWRTADVEETVWRAMQVTEP
jgi:hypothetical protein